MPLSLRVLVLALLAACTSLDQAPVEPLLDNQFLVSRIKGIGADSTVDARLVRHAPYFHQAFENAVCGDADAQYWAGFDNHYGVDLSVDLVAAQLWYTLAARQGHATAIQARNSLAPQLTADEQDQARTRAANWRPLGCSRQVP